MTNTPICWVVQEGKNDYAPAEEFGEVRFITHGDLRAMEGKQNEEVHHDIKRFKSVYIPGKDCIIPTGNPMLVSLVMMSLDKNQEHRLLKWDGRRATYIPYTINPSKVN